MAFKLLFFIIITPTLLFSEPCFAPWGDDKDIEEIDSYRANKAPSRPFSQAGTSSVIRFHQRVLSQADGPRSHFYPSSSQYMLDAIRQHGFFWGFCMGCDRLQRENSDRWYYPIKRTRDGDFLKYNPVLK